MENCIFCKIIKGEIPSYKLYEDENVISFLDVNPFSYGHALVIPKKHVLDYEEIDLDTITSINNAGKQVYKLLKEKLNPESIQLVQNNGKLQEVKHYHLHLIPYYSEEKSGKENVEEVYNSIMN